MILRKTGWGARTVAIAVLVLVPGLPAYAQATLDTFASSRNAYGGVSPLWAPFTGGGSGGGTMPDQSMTIAGRFLANVGSVADSTVYSVVSLTPGNPTTIVTNPATNWTATQQSVTFKNIVGTGCSMLPTNIADPAGPLITSVAGTTVVLALDTTGCALTSANVYLNCGKSCGFYFDFKPYPYTWATSGFAQQWIMGGSWSDNYNRMRTIFKVNKTVLAGYDGSAYRNLYQGTYFKPTNENTFGNQGGHAYQVVGIDLFPNVWYTLDVTNKIYNMSGANSTHDDWPLDRGMYVDNNNPGHYLSQMTRFYYSSDDDGPVNTYDRWSKTTIMLSAGPQYSTVSGAADSYVGTMIYGYTGPQTGTAGRYDVGWEGPSNVAGSFELKYSTNSMVANGFSTGTPWTTVNMFNADSTIYRASTPDITPQPANMFIGLRPHMGIGWVATGPTGDIMVSTGSGNVTDPWMADGAHVAVTNVSGCTAANGNWTTTTLPRGAFNRLDNTLISIAVDASGITTATTASPHGLTVGRYVKVFNATVSNQYMLGAPILSVPDSTHFRFQWCANYECTAWPTAGTYTEAPLVLYYAQAAVLTGSGACNSAFIKPPAGTNPWPTLVSTDDKTNFTELQITSAPPGYSPCDVNKDGVVNVLDVVTNCSLHMTGGTCLSSAVQPIVNAALGSACTLGQ